MNRRQQHHYKCIQRQLLRVLRPRNDRQPLIAFEFCLQIFLEKFNFPPIFHWKIDFSISSKNSTNIYKKSYYKKFLIMCQWQRPARFALALFNRKKGIFKFYNFWNNNFYNHSNRWFFCRHTYYLPKYHSWDTVEPEFEAFSPIDHYQLSICLEKLWGNNFQLFQRLHPKIGKKFLSQNWTQLKLLKMKIFTRS